MDNKLKIENFCELNNERFKIYYKYLCNPEYLSIFLNYLELIKTPEFQVRLKKNIEKNKSYIMKNLENIDIVISFYKKNSLINKSEIGKFFSFYEKNKSKSILKLFLKIMNYTDLIPVLKEILYIFSDYRACIYFMTPSINFYDHLHTKKEVVKEVVLKFRDNLNTLNQIISGIYIGYNNKWGSPYYSTANSMFETLIILRKYFNNPLKLLKITFQSDYKNNKNMNMIFKKLLDKYNKNKLTDNNIENIISISQFIVNLKRLGYDMWFVIPLVFDSIYQNYEIHGLQEPLVFGNKKLYFQRINYEIGFMCYKLVEDGFISNINIFNNFNF